MLIDKPVMHRYIFIKPCWLLATAYYRGWAKLWNKNKIEFSLARSVRDKYKQNNYKNLKVIYSDTGDVY